MPAETGTEMRPEDGNPDVETTVSEVEDPLAPPWTITVLSGDEVVMVGVMALLNVNADEALPALPAESFVVAVTA